MNTLSEIDQLEAMALFYAKKARDARRAAKKAAAAEEEAAAAAPAAADLPQPPALLPAQAWCDDAPSAAADESASTTSSKREIIIRPNTALSVPEDVEDLVDRVRNGGVAAPLDGTGTARYTKDWLAGRRGDPGNPLCFQIREQIRAGVNTKKTIAAALEGVSYKQIDAAVREMNKMGVILA